MKPDEIADIVVNAFRTRLGTVLCPYEITPRAIKVEVVGASVVVTVAGDYGRCTWCRFWHFHAPPFTHLDAASSEVWNRT